jgi:hypothetical protein
MAVRKSKNVAKARAQTRHTAQNLGVGGFLMFILGRFEGLTTTESLWLYGGGMVILSALWKALDDTKLIARLVKRIGPASLVVLLSVGCAGMVGTSTPVELTGTDGDPVIAHEVKGVAWSFWDAGIGANVEGGSGGETTVDLLTAVIETAGRILGGVFTGLGGIGSSVVEASSPPP